MRGAHPVMEIRPDHPLHKMVIRDQVTIHILKTRDSISPEPFSSHRLEKLRIFLSNLNISDSTHLFPIYILQFQSILQVKLHNSPKVSFRNNEGPGFLKRVKQQNNFVSIPN